MLNNRHAHMLKNLVRRAGELLRVLPAGERRAPAGAALRHWGGILSGAELRRIPAALAAALLFTLALGTGCSRRPLEDPSEYTRVKVKVNVKSIHNVTCDIYNDKIPHPEINPEAMHIIFFNQDADVVAAETFITDVETDEDGTRSLVGDIAIYPGTYRMLIYDYGTEDTIVKDFYTYDKAYAYTEAAPYSVLSKFSVKAGELADIVNEPDHLVVASNPAETIPFHDGLYTISTEAHSVVESWYLQIKVDGLEYVSSAQAVLSGMVRENLIATDTRVNDPEATVWFKLQKSDDDGVPVICTVFNTFGRIAESTNELSVTFNIQTTDGRTVKREFDISDLFLTDDAVNHHWLLLEETIKIDPPSQTGGGFDPAVEDWEEEHHEIEL